VLVSAVVGVVGHEHDATAEIQPGGVVLVKLILVREGRTGPTRERRGIEAEDARDLHPSGEHVRRLNQTAANVLQRLRIGGRVHVVELSN
jgi:hypothetical protein